MPPSIATERHLATVAPFHLPRPMAPDSILHRLEAEFDIPSEPLRATVALLEAGATPQYVDYYCRPETGNLGEERIASLLERLQFLTELEARKQSILEQAAQRGADLSALAARLEDVVDQDVLDDVYQTFRPKRAGSEGRKAEEKGLGPLALAILHRTLGDETPMAAAEAYRDEAKGLGTVEAVLEGVTHILAEQFAADPELRDQIRRELGSGNLKATAVAPDRKGAQRYREFFAFEEPVKRIPPQRMLALRRAEREGIVQLRLTLPEGRALELMRARFAADLSPDSPLAAFLDVVFQYAYESRLYRACEEDVRRHAKEKADRETVRNHLRNLRAQLLAAPLGAKKAMALRASGKIAWLVVLAEDGSIATRTVLPLTAEGLEAAPADDAAEATTAATDAPTEPASGASESTSASETPSGGEAGGSETGGIGTNEKSETDDSTEAAAPDTEAQPAAAPTPEEAGHRASAVDEIVRILATERPEGIALPHGRRHDLAADLLRQALAKLPDYRPIVVTIEEAPSAIHATTPAGRRGLGGTDAGLRTTVSLARRLQDPLRELVAMDIRALCIGAGIPWNELHQGLLTRHLDAWIGSALCLVSVDLNRVDADELERLPGFSKELVKATLETRQKSGGFRSLAAWRDALGVDETTFRNVAGFLRVYGGDEPLDATGMHPANYEIAHAIAEQRGVPTAELLGASLRDVELEPLVAKGYPRGRVLDVLHYLANVGRDPRGELVGVRNEGLTSFDDLKPDLELRGRVTNLADFGAFIDLGLGHDGLVHVSEIHGSRRGPGDQQLRVGEVITVYVLRVEPKDKRISLSMHRPRHLVENRSATLGERMASRGAGRSGAGDGRRGPRERGPERQEPVVQNRAARAPEGRRGVKRGMPNRPKHAGGDDRSRGGGDRERANDFRGPRGPMREGGQPRVITVESSRPNAESLGHKGEMRSLSALRGLLAKGDAKDDTD